jgi:hypothetical protein
MRNRKLSKQLEIVLTRILSDEHKAKVRRPVGGWGSIHSAD